MYVKREVCCRVVYQTHARFRVLSILTSMMMASNQTMASSNVDELKMIYQNHWFELLRYQHYQKVVQRAGNIPQCNINDKIRPSQNFQCASYECSQINCNGKSNCKHTLKSNTIPMKKYECGIHHAHEHGKIPTEKSRLVLRSDEKAFTCPLCCEPRFHQLCNLKDHASRHLGLSTYKYVKRVANKTFDRNSHSRTQLQVKYVNRYVSSSFSSEE